jgi:hypothetical protein
MKCRRLNSHGINAFAKYLRDVRMQPKLPVPRELLASPQSTEPLVVVIEAEVPAKFDDRMAFAKWLHKAATNHGIEAVRNDDGFWAWLSLALFDHICPQDCNGQRKLKEDARYLPMLETSRRYYRHALLGPFSVYWLYRNKAEDAAALLCGSLTQLTDEAYRLFVENQLVVMPSAVGVLTRLFFDGSTGKLKRGSKTKTRGSIRRLAKHLTRCARTLDLDIIPTDKLLETLPPEFNRWRDLDEHSRCNSTQDE